MTFLITGSQDVLKLPQYIEETTEGTMPTSGTFSAIAPTALFSLISDKGAVPIFTIGSRDPNAILDGLHVSGFTLRFNPINTSFLQYAFNLANGTGTIAKTLSFMAEIQVGGGGGNGSGTAYYFTANDARLATATITSTVRSPILAEVYVLCKNPTFTTTAPSPTAATLTGSALMYYSGGTNTLTYGPAGVNAGTVHARIDNNLAVVPILGNQDYQTTMPGARDIRVVFSGLFSDPTGLWTSYANFTSQTLTWTLDSTNNHSLAVTSAQLVSLTDLGFDISDLTVSGRFGLRGSMPVEELKVRENLHFRPTRHLVRPPL